MNIVKRELKAHLKSLLIWCGSMIFLIYAGMIKYSAFSETGEAVNEFMDSLPAQMKTILGLGDGNDLTSVAVFYSIFFLYFLLLAAVFSTMLGVTILAKEERDRTSDFLFTKPVTRVHVITCKIIAAVINLFVFTLVTLVASLLFVQPYLTEGMSLFLPIFLVCTALFFLELLFFGIGLFLASVTKNAKKASSLATLIILGTFILKVIIELYEKAKPLGFLSPFYYYNAQDLMFDRTLDVPFTILTLLLATAGACACYYFYQKRELLS